MPPSEPPIALRDSPWSNHRILTLLALGTLIVSLVWRLPEELEYLGERTAELLVMLTLAAAFTYLLRPIVNWMCRSRLFGGVRGGCDDGTARSRGRRTLAVALVFVLVGVVIYAFGAVSYKQIAGEVRDLEVVQSFMAKSPEAKRHMLSDWRGTLRNALAPAAHKIGIDDRNLNAMLDWAQRSAQKAPPHLQGWASRLSSIVEALLLPVLVFYFLADGAAIRREADLLIPIKWRPRVGHALTNFDRVFDGYVRGQIIMCVIAWVMVSALLLVLHVPHWFTLGLVAGLTRAIPIIGPLLGGIPLVLVSLVETHDLRIVGILLVCFTLMHFLESKILLPRIIGHEVDLHPVAVIIALLLGLKFFGLLGVFLSVPFAAAGKVFLSEWHDANEQHEATSVQETSLQEVSHREHEIPEATALPVAVTAPLGPALGGVAPAREPTAERSPEAS